MFIKIDEAIHSDITKTNYQFEGQETFSYFGSTDTVNIFVGANNSGKSRFLRGLIKSKDIIFVNRIDFESIYLEITIICNEIIEHYNQNPNESFGFSIYNPDNQYKRFFNDTHEWLAINTPTNQSSISLNADYFKALKADILIEWQSNNNNFNHLIERKTSEILFAIEINPGNNPVGLNTIEQSGTLRIFHNYYIWEPPKLLKLIGYLNQINKLKIQKTFLKAKRYIPILRTANTLFEETSATNLKRITKNIFKDTVKINYIFNEINEDTTSFHTGLDLYQNIRKIRNSKKDVRNNFAAFEKFLSENFFHGKEVDIVALDADKEEDQHISLYIGGEERKIHELGDGIQAIIMLMYPIFTAEDESWIFIEEPEINLHPSLQRIFLEQILKNEVIVKKKLKFFLTTHSNHLLDLSLELEKGISIFTFEKTSQNESNPIFKIKNVKSRDTDILRLLGVNNSSVFMANCSIWVEGICDRLYIRAYLRAYENHKKLKTSFKEDIHFAFFEYAGSNVSHYFFDNPDEFDELSEEEKNKIHGQFLSNKIFLLADKDAGKDKKHTSFLEQENKNFQYECLEVKEIENLLSPEQLRRFLPKINKKIESSILSKKEIEQEKYKEEYLGNYLKNKLGKEIISDSFLANSGTLATYYKNKLAEVASVDMNWDEMSSEAQKLAENVYDFIKISNTTH